MSRFVILYVVIVLNVGFTFGTESRLTTDDYLESDGYESRSSPYDDGDTPRCSNTRNARYPWWRIDLQKPYLINRITIFKKDSYGDDPFGKMMEIRIGDVDIASSGSDSEIFMANYLVSRGKLSQGVLNFSTSMSFVGRYVSIQVVDTEWLRNVRVNLRLCEVLIFGVPFDKYLNLNVSQVETLSHDDLQELTDVCRNDEFDKLQKQESCVFLSTTRASIQIELQQQSFISEIVFEAHDFSHYIDVRISDVNLQNLSLDSMIKNSNSCFAGKLIQNFVTSIKCQEPIKGDFVTILFLKECSSNRCAFDVDDDFNATICGLEIWGITVFQSTQLPTISLKKSTLQSSVFNKADGHLAVDGDTYTKFYHFGSFDRPVCTHSQFGDLYPWWRVDFGEMHVVVSLNIHNRDEANLYTRLHDIDILVGKNDIRWLPSKTVFRENFVCRSLRNSYLQRNKNYMMCHQPLLGRYLSIQITQTCQLATCHSRAENILTLCEVTVFGYPIVYMEIYNLSVNKSTSSSLLTSDLHKGDIYEINGAQAHSDDLGWKSGLKISDYPWWSIDFQDIHVIEGLTFYMDEELIKGSSNLFEVRVGFENVNTLSLDDFMSKTPLCTQMNTYEILLSKQHELLCSQPIIGRYLTIQLQEKCTDQDCLHILMSLVHIDIWGYKLKKTWPKEWVKNLISRKGTQKSALNYALSVTSGIIPKKPFDYFGACSFCALRDGELPRWSYKLGYLSYVHTVVLYNRKDEKSNQLHDIKIFVNFINRETCAEIENVIPKGRNEYQCMKPLLGRHVEIQIFKRCEDVKLCPESANNILSLCGIEVFGLYRHLKIITNTRTNVASFMPTLQSSTASNASSALAVDGKFFPSNTVPECQIQKGIEDEIKNCNLSLKNASCLPIDCEYFLLTGATKSGIYSIYRNQTDDWKQVYCDMTHVDPGWMVILRRGEFFGDQESFNRHEAASKHGFGNLCKEFWLGTETITQVYRTENCHLIKIDVVTSNWTKYAEEFVVMKRKNKYEIGLLDPEDANASKFYGHLKECMHGETDPKNPDNDWFKAKWRCLNVNFNISQSPGLWDPKLRSFQPTGILATEIKMRACAHSAFQNDMNQRM